MLEPRDFDADLKAIFSKHREPLKAREPIKHFIDVEVRRFNVVKETEHGRKPIAFGITIADAFRGIEGRFKDTETVKYHIVRAEAT